MAQDAVTQLINLTLKSVGQPILTDSWQQGDRAIRQLCVQLANAEMRADAYAVALNRLMELADEAHNESFKAAVCAALLNAEANINQRSKV